MKLHCLNYPMVGYRHLRTLVTAIMPSTTFLPALTYPLGLVTLHLCSTNGHYIKIRSGKTINNTIFGMRQETIIFCLGISRRYHSVVFSIKLKAPLRTIFFKVPILQKNFLHLLLKHYRWLPNVGLLHQILSPPDRPTSSKIFYYKFIHIPSLLTKIHPYLHQTLSV